MTQRALRITIVQGPYLPVPPLRGTSVERILFTLGKAWARRGCRVVQISRRYPGLPDHEQLDGVEHCRVPSRDTPRSGLLFRLGELRYGLRVLGVLPDADIVITNSPLLPLLLRRRRHGLIYVRLGRPPKGQLRFYRHVARVQALSRAVARMVEAEAPWLANRVRVIGNPLSEGLDQIDRIDPTAARHREVLYVGRIDPEKGLDLLIDAFRRFAATPAGAGWTLRLVGPWDVAAGAAGPAYLEQLQRAAGPLADRIDFAGPVIDANELAAVYRRAAVFAYPSLAERGEAFPNSPLEAMAGGCPPIVSALPQFRDYLDDGDTGLVFDHRGGDAAAALAAAFARFADLDDDAVAQLRRRCLARAGDYRVDAIAERLLDDFRELLRDSPA